MPITGQLKTIHSNFSFGLLSFCLLQRMKPQDFSSMNRVIIGEDGLYCVPRGEGSSRRSG